MKLISKANYVEGKKRVYSVNGSKPHLEYACWPSLQLVLSETFGARRKSQSSSEWDCREDLLPLRPRQATLTPSSCEWGRGAS